jgi:hypothetical protein
MPITLPRALNDRCTCGHLRGEHLTREGGDTTAYCLMQGCQCPQFERARRKQEKAGATTQD